MSTVSAADAATSRAAQSGWTSASGVARNRVPIATPAAPADDRGPRTACVGDAAGGDDGHRKRPRQLPDQREHPDLALHVAARLDPLRHDRIAACLDGRRGLRGRPGLRDARDTRRHERG